MAQVDYHVHKLFPTPVYRSKVNIDVLTYHKLATDNLEWETEDRYGGAIITHKETKERHILNLPQFAGLKKQVQNHIETFAFNVLEVQKDIRWEITTSWVNQVVKGGYSSMHTHANSLISGVMYLSCDEKTGGLAFHKDAGYQRLWHDTIRLDFDKITDYTSEASVFMPAVNDILIFPSILAHSVLINESDLVRYSLAFNAFPRGVFGRGGNSELTL